MEVGCLRWVIGLEIGGGESANGVGESSAVTPIFQAWDGGAWVWASNGGKNRRRLASSVREDDPEVQELKAEVTKLQAEVAKIDEIREQYSTLKMIVEQMRMSQQGQSTPTDEEHPTRSSSTDDES
ncbi:hypothetical protein CASFOL_026020 [Castilleja foliolosa]|uniref:Uncharacterized protein n=1 Tax=Castilleja foliolosa TaxID=1961234 RepID=A0ABD3CSR6_9LAMI